VEGKLEVVACGVGATRKKKVASTAGRLTKIVQKEETCALGGFFGGGSARRIQTATRKGRAKIRGGRREKRALKGKKNSLFKGEVGSGLSARQKKKPNRGGKGWCGLERGNFLVTRQGGEKLGGRAAGTVGGEKRRIGVARGGGQLRKRGERLGANEGRGGIPVPA